MGHEKEDLLASVPGVGPITARTLIAELPELGTLDGKRIASLAGLAPFTRQSGQWKGKGMIARFVEATKPDLRELPDEATQLLADLVARRRQIIEMIVAERNREKRVAVMRIRKSLARLIAALEKELAEIDAEIDAGVRGSPAWREKEDLLASVPGVGPITARTLIAELPELGTLDGKRIASLAGLAPFTRQSGQWKGKALIAGGRKSVRSALFLASLAACRHNPVLKAFRQRLIDAGKPKMLVAIAAARKLLTILNAILRDKQPWRPESA